LRSWCGRGDRVSGAGPETFCRLTIAMVALALAIPDLPGAGLLGFVPPPGALLMTQLIITGLYVVAAEITKHWFYRNHAAPA
jgi:hypothetical protein